MNLLERLQNLYAQDKYDDHFDRCWDCQNWESYYFDEYDSDAWCGLGLNKCAKHCVKFRKEEEEE